MKKFIVLVMVLAMASMANATVIDVVPDGVGTSGHAGTAADKLVAGETIKLKLMLNWNPGSYPGGTYASYDGYVLSAMDLMLTASSQGTMDVVKNAKSVPQWTEHTDWTFKGSPTIVSNVLDTGGAYASSASTLGTTLGIDTWVGPAGSGSRDTMALLDTFYVVAAGTGDITLTWGLAPGPEVRPVSITPMSETVL